METTFPATGQASTGPGQHDQRSFLLQRAQPAMAGLIDGSLSTLAPIFAVAFATHQPRYAFLAGLATAIGAGVSMAFSEGLSDTGDLTGRGRPYLRGAITGAGTFLGGIVHTLPFLVPQYRSAVLLALAVIAFELLALAWIRRRFFGTGFLSSIIRSRPAGRSSPRSAPRWVPSDDRRRRFSMNPHEGPRPSGHIKTWSEPCLTSGKGLATHAYRAREPVPGRLRFAFCLCGQRDGIPGAAGSQRCDGSGYLVGPPVVERPGAEDQAVPQRAVDEVQGQGGVVVLDLASGHGPSQYLAEVGAPGCQEPVPDLMCHGLVGGGRGGDAVQQAHGGRIG